jgi:hypothetical protein
MHNKHKFFILGFVMGFIVPFSENAISGVFDLNKPFVGLIIFGEKVWQYIFLYVIVINSALMYVQRFRTKINPESRFVFLLSGVSSGFAIVSIIAATIEFF